jgi:hypothetical protein
MHLPFEEDFPPRARLEEAIVGTIVFFLFIAVLTMAPWWGMMV